MQTVGLPPAPAVPINDPGTGQVSVPWYRFFSSLFQVTGSGGSTQTLPQVIAALAALTASFAAQRLALVLPSWLAVSGSPVIGGTGTFTVTGAVEPANNILASPDGSTGPLSPRRLVGGDLPDPSATTLGGIESLSPPIVHQWINGISNVGVPLTAQPAFTDVSGAITGAQSAPGVATNSNATAGYPGEFVSSSVAAGSAVALTTGVSVDVTTISLTAGDWDVDGLIHFAPAVAAAISATAGGISQTINTLPTPPDGGYVGVAGLTQAAGTEISLTLGRVRQSLSGTTTIHLVVAAMFSSTCGAYGILQARRSGNVH